MQHLNLLLGCLTFLLMLSGCKPNGLVFIESASADTQTVTVKNDFDEAYNISGWYIENKAKSGKYFFPAGSLLPGGSSLSVFRKDLPFEIQSQDEALFLKNTAHTVMDIYVIDGR
ncbi:MAG: hypothetical protein KatS3mg031_1867 [Chitinophagales bacterium]|nr:MAG: hypothetical protein KatS3mg031_1867 [Chitinophagales bacterium]